jgi:hypothetical protein
MLGVKVIFRFVSAFFSLMVIFLVVRAVCAVLEPAAAVTPSGLAGKSHMSVGTPGVGRPGVVTWVKSSTTSLMTDLFGLRLARTGSVIELRCAGSGW